MDAAGGVAPVPPVACGVVAGKRFGSRTIAHLQGAYNLGAYNLGSNNLGSYKQRT